MLHCEKGWDGGMVETTGIESDADKLMAITVP
jgi:hypothetical protein